jgi:hypothetical protein
MTMNKTSLRIVLVLIPVIAASVFSHWNSAKTELETATSAEESFAQELVDQLEGIPPMSSADANSIIQHALRADRSIVFFDVDWSLTSKMELRKYAKFSIEYCENHEDAPIQFHYVDCTDIRYDFLKRNMEWNEKMQERGTFFHGNGEAAWFLDGKLMDVRSLFEFRTSAEFDEHTSQLLGQ